MTTDRNLQPGCTVYSQHGEEAEFVACAGGEYVVRPVFEDDDGPHFGDVTTWREVFRTPPAPKLDAATAAAEKRLADLQLQVAEREGQLYAFEREEKARQKRLQRHEALADLDDYLAGKITHYLTFNQYDRTVAILPVDETIENYPSSYQHGLLTLYPCKNWSGLNWVLNHLPKGAREYDGKAVTVELCRSEEEAKAKAQHYLRTYLAAYMATEPGKRYYTDALIRNCRQHGVEVPQDLLDWVEANRVTSLQSQLEDLRKKAAAIEAQLAPPQPADQA